MSTASHESANDVTSPGPIASRKRIQWGSIIFFKVEESVFEAPRYRFAEHSEVFDAMFHLPAGSDGNVEGGDEDHPIVLEGYQAAHFEALLKVLCPTIDDIISGSFNLGKDEWIGVINLSTRWSMKRIRSFAISELSKLSLSPIEKVALGREHKVAKWFQDGLTELVARDSIQPLAELKSQLGEEIACTILWIQNQTLRRPHKEGLVLTGLTLSMLACWYCKAAILNSSQNCISCAQVIALDDCNALYLARGRYAMWIDPYIPPSGPAQAFFCVNLGSVMCRNCSKQALAFVAHTCPSCTTRHHYPELSLLPGKKVGGDDEIQMILDEFGDEIARYKSFDE